MLEARGVPDTEIDGGWEFNSWAALQRSGFFLPYEGGGSVPDFSKDSNIPPCKPLFYGSIAGLHARYALSSNPNGFGGAG